MFRDASSLREFCADRGLNTPEINTSNDFYGHARAMKAYAGRPLNVSLKASMEHGAALVDKCWDELLRAPLPAVLVMSRFRKEVVTRLTDKPVHVLGPFLHYAGHALPPEERTAQRQRLGRMLLAFPVHSSHNITIDCCVDSFCRKLERLGKDFDSIVVCVYWKDVLLGRADEYVQRGFEVVSCGHMFDLDFLPRLKTLLRLASLTVSNGLSTALGYSLSMNIPSVILPTILGLGAATPEIFAREFTSYHDTRAFDFSLIEEAFGDPQSGITPKQLELARHYLGLGCEKSPAELAALFDELEASHAAMQRPENRPMHRGQDCGAP